MSTPPVDRRTLAAIAPKLAELTETVLFGDIWARSELSPRERSLITLSALTAQGKTEQLPWLYRVRLSEWPEPGRNCRIVYPSGVLCRLAGGGQRPDLPECAGGVMPLTRISLGTAWRPAEFAQLSALFHAGVWWRSSTFRQQIDFSLSNGPPMSSAFTTRTTSAKDAAPASCCFIFSPENRAAGRRNRGFIVGSAHG